MIKAKFIENLMVLSLDGNIKIGDPWIKIIIEHKNWNCLRILSLNKTGLTDISLAYLGESKMTKLKFLDIKGNNFNKSGKASIDALRMNNIHVEYKDLNDDANLSDKNDELIFKKTIKYSYFL